MDARIEIAGGNVATRLTEQSVIIRNLQKALAYWMPKVFDDRSAHDAYLLVGYDGEDEVGYWDQRAAAQLDEGAFYELLTAYGEARHLMTNSKRIAEAKDAVLSAFERATAPQGDKQ